MKKQNLSFNDIVKTQNQVEKSTNWKSRLYEILTTVELIEKRTSISLTLLNEWKTKGWEILFTEIENANKRNEEIDKINFRSLLETAERESGKLTVKEGAEFQEIFEKTQGFKVTYFENCGAVETKPTLCTANGFRICWNSVKLIDGKTKGVTDISVTADEKKEICKVLNIPTFVAEMFTKGQWKNAKKQYLQILK